METEIIIPELTLKDQKIMVQIQGQYGPFKPEKDLKEAILDLSLRFKTLLLRPATSSSSIDQLLNILQALPSHVEYWVDAYPRDMGDIMDLFMSGASRVIVRTGQLRSTSQLKDLLDFSSEIVIWVGGELGGQPIAAADIITKASSMGLNTFILEEGSMPLKYLSDPDMHLYLSLKTHIPGSSGDWKGVVVPLEAVIGNE